MLGLAALLTVALCVSTAPLNPKEEAVKHVRVKRAAESIIYGNHQNNARSKNTGPAMHLDSQKAKKSSVDVNPVPVDSTANEATENNIDVANELPQDENKEPATDNNNDNLILQKAEGEEEGQLSSLVNNGQQTESGLNEEESSGDEGDSLPNNPNAVGMQDNGFDYDDLLNYFYSSYKPSQPRERQTRSLPALTAEQMTMGADPKPMRVKRDLTADDIRTLLEEEKAEEANDYPYDFDDEQYIPLEDSEREDPEDLENVMGELQKEYIPAFGSPYQQGYYGYETPEEQKAEELEEEEEEERREEEEEEEEEEEAMEEARTKMALLQYLYGDSNDEREAEEEEEKRNKEYGYPGEVEESWHDLGPVPEEEYQMITYRGKRGMFIPMKRQFLSMVPGNKKRSFYPYSYEPASRWSALVAQSEEEKRNEDDMYERLYRLAEGLKGSPNQEEEDYWEKKK